MQFQGRPQFIVHSNLMNIRYPLNFADNRSLFILWFLEFSQILCYCNRRALLIIRCLIAYSEIQKNP